MPNPTHAAWVKKDQHLKRQLQCLSHGSKSCSKYLQGAKPLANQLVAIRKPTDDKDLISFIFNGLNGFNPSFHSFVTSFSLATQDNLLSFADFQDELLNHEMFLQQQQAAVQDPSNFALIMQKQGFSSSNRYLPRCNSHNFHKRDKNHRTTLSFHQEMGTSNLLVALNTCSSISQIVVTPPRSHVRFVADQIIKPWTAFIV